jgi:hypothetical protein
MSHDRTIIAGASYESSENEFASGNVGVFQQQQSNSTCTVADEPTIRWDLMGFHLSLVWDWSELI